MTLKLRIRKLVEAGDDSSIVETRLFTGMICILLLSRSEIQRKVDNNGKEYEIFSFEMIESSFYINFKLIFEHLAIESEY